MTDIDRDKAKIRVDSIQDVAEEVRDTARPRTAPVHAPHPSAVRRAPGRGALR